MDQVDTAIDVLVASLPASNAPKGRTGRGGTLLRFSGKEVGAALLRGGAVAAVPVVWRLVLKLLDLWM
jgi:hypothetical protein